MKKEALRKFFEQYRQLSSKALNDLAKESVYKNIPKGKLLLVHGQVSHKIYIVTKGCLRLYYIANDIEITVYFSFENDSAIELSSFLSNTVSEYFIEAIEDSEIVCLQKYQLEKLYKTHPELEGIFRVFWEKVILFLLKRFTALQKDSAEKRYLDLMNQPKYLQRIPQKYLASYIGITPTSLSRIRKKK